jgi:hypothetical protein
MTIGGEGKMPLLDWHKWLAIGLIVVACIAAAILFWGQLHSVPRGVDITILVLALFVVAALQVWPATATADRIVCDGYKACVAWLLALGGGALVVFVLVWVLVKFTGGAPGSNAIALPMIVLVGVIVLLIVISLVTFTFSVLGLASPTEALGLPDGSVRSIIALMLLVLFSIVSIFLYNSVATSGTKSVEHVSSDQLTAMRAQVSVIFALAEAAPATAGGTAPATPPGTPPTTAAAPTPATFFTVYYRDTNPAADDIAKQLIVLLGTLVTAVASFYFGANAVASANAAALGQQNGDPKVTSISPNPIPPGDAPQTLTLTGSSLGKITKLHLEQTGQPDIPGQAVNHPNDSTVTAQVLVKGMTGSWDVVVVEDDEKKSITVGKVDIKAG